MKILIVYNTCGISGRENIVGYGKSISSILAQNKSHLDTKIVVSSCKNTPESLRFLKGIFDKEISINYIDEVLPVNVTFNHTVLESVKRFGQFDMYLYIDSGVSLPYPDHNIIDDMASCYVLGENINSMISINVENDNGYEFWGLDKLAKDPWFYMPIGKTVNLHCQMFSKDILEAYGRIIPDIFAAYCTESVFSFMNAAIKRKWVVLPTITVNHIKEMDGASSGFAPGGRHPPGIQSWQYLFRSPKTIEQICEEGKPLGFGYEEVQNILIHDPNQFDENGYCKNDQLKDFIKDNLFLKQEQLDYNKIQGAFYE